MPEKIAKLDTKDILLRMNTGSLPRDIRMVTDTILAETGSARGVSLKFLNDCVTSPGVA